MEPARTIVAAVLAAGAGTRLGGPKAELVVGGQRLLDRTVTMLRAAGADRIVAVVRDGSTCDADVVVTNPEPARGMRSSLALAVDAAEGTDALAVVLVDTPGLDAASVRAVLSVWRPDRIAVATSAGRRGHPIVMAPRRWRDAIAQAGPDEGARAYLDTHRELLDVVEVDADLADLDTPEDVARWEARS